ncbi:MAG TPA: TlpA family protein disulfide reductase [Deltaproteobacteria bacterium]|nr:TlpA family protein disulfide reductase [Deltaproteobacteria bacterium]
MIKRFVMIAVVLVLALSPVVSGGDAGDTYDIREQSIEVSAADFTLRDLEGKTHVLSEYAGKTVLLNFTTTWCPYCIKDIPNLKKIYSEYKDRDFVLFSIYIQESDTKVASFAKKYKLPYTVLLDTDGRIAQSYGVRGVPTKILVDKKGTILCLACRSLDVMLDKEMGKGN